MSKINTTKLQEGVLQSNDDILSGSIVEKKTVRENIVKRKILFVTRPIAPPWDEASKNFAYQLALNLAKINSNLEIHLLTKGQLSGIPENIVQHPIYTSAENDFSFSQKIRSLLFQWRMKNEFDIVHYFFTPSRLNGFVIKHFLYPQKSKTLQTIATLREDLMSPSRLRRSLFGDILVTYSDYSKKRLKRLGFVNVQHIYPGIDLADFTPRDKNPELLRAYGFQADDFIIGFTGEYVRLGGVDNIIKSFQKVVLEIPQVKLFLNVRVKNQKDAEKKKEVMKTLKDLKLLDKVVFAEMDYLKTWGMSAAYNLYDLAIFPIQNMRGKFDVPLVVPEAMACGKANILSSLPLLKEFANHNTAVIINKNDPDELTEAIVDLYKNPEKRKEIADNGMKYVRRNFNIEFIAEEYNDLYDKF
jgi:glycosyltransferase involved in cell wall biosynthesis